MTELLPLSPALHAASHSPSEFEVLCALSVTDPAAGQLEFIANLDLSTLQWPDLIRAAESHGVLPLVARNLVEHRRDLSGELLRELRAAYETNLKRNLRFAAELDRIAQHLQRSQLRAIPFKGVVLAESAYHDLGLRSFSDLDFLVSPADFIRAKGVLAEIGYRPPSEASPAVESLWLRVGYECAFDGSAGKNLLELQWAALPYFYAVDLRADDLLARARRRSIAAREVLDLSAEDLLLMLCLHAAKHLWTRLIWLSDIAQTLRTETINFAVLSSRARASGVVRMVALSLWLARNLLQLQLPAAAEPILAADPQVPDLGHTFAERLARGASYDFESTEYFRFILKLRERRTDRWRYLWRLVWTPGAGDVSAVCLPALLFPLYRVVRLGRLSRKLVLPSLKRPHAG